MTQTDNLHLNIWSPQDAVDVEQINSNFRALDAAHVTLTQEQGKVESRFPKTLLDVTTQSQAQQVDLDLHTISLADYDWIDVYLDLAGLEMGSCDVSMRVNNNADNTYTIEEQSGRGTSFNLFSVRAQDETNLQKVRFFCGQAPIFTGFVTCIAGRSANTFTTRKSVAITIPATEVTSLNLFAPDEGNVIPTGSRIRIVGVKL